MKIRRAVITAAGPNQDRLPLQRLVDVDGIEKTALQIIVEEVIGAGVEEICVVVRPGNEQAYAEAAGDYARMLSFVEQPTPRGYGDALHRACAFVGDQPFVHLVSDHLYLSGESRRCAQQLVEAAQREQCPVSAVQATHESLLPYYGAMGGRRVPGRTLHLRREPPVESGKTMDNELIRTITSSDPLVRNRSLDAFCRAASLDRLLESCQQLDRLRRASDWD